MKSPTSFLNSASGRNASTLKTAMKQPSLWRPVGSTPKPSPVQRPPRTLSHAAEPGQEATEDLDHDGQTGALVAAIGAAQWQQRATLAQLARVVGGLAVLPD